MLAAALFGISTPLSKLLVGHTNPLMLAGLLYLGSGLGLSLLMIGRRSLHHTKGGHSDALTVKDLPWFMGAVVAGGILGPALLMYGLTSTPGSSASLLLNLEGVLTALLAWFVFQENFDRRIFWGMVASSLAVYCCLGNKHRNPAALLEYWQSPVPVYVGASTIISRVKYRPVTPFKLPGSKAW